ncbi:MAG TPA: tripartite tricarboxylate transporter substrate binding protein [Xanthobacteraceae bacterium]
MRQIALSALAAIGLACCTTGAFAQADWKPDRNVEIIVGTPPGSGYDSVARKLQEIWQTAGLVEKSVTVVNKPGGFNAVGNAYLNSHPGNGNYVAITGTLLLSDNLSGNTTISYKDFTPLAVLLNEEIVFAVNPASPIKTGKDFIDRLKQDPSSVSVSISGIGGQNHIALGLVAQAGGADASKLKVVGFQGGAEAVTAVLGAHVDATVAPASIVAPQLEAGKLRVIGVPSEKRLGGVYAQVPTWREQGVDTVFSQWRGLMGPKGLTAAQIAYWDGVLGKTVATKDWKDHIERTQLTYRYLDSGQSRDFITAQNETVRGILTSLGLIKK